MNNEAPYSVNESIQTIQDVLKQAKYRYQKNSLLILFWGLLIASTGIIQFLMIQFEYSNISHFAWACTMIPGFLITFIIKWNEAIQNKNENNPPSNPMDYLWMVAGIMAMLSGFLFYNKFGIGLYAMIYAPFCMAAFAFSFYIRETLFVVLSMVSTLVCFSSLIIPPIYHPLLATLIAILIMIIPGFKLHKEYKNHQRV